MRRRFIQLPDGSLVEWSPLSLPALPPDSGALWGDAHYANLRATDGTPIDTRTKHREYMRQTGLTTMDDYSQEWRKAQAMRERFLTGARDEERAQDVARAVEKCSNIKR